MPANVFFLLIISEVILHGDENELKLHRWAVFSFILIQKMFLLLWEVPFRKNIHLTRGHKLNHDNEKLRCCFTTHSLPNLLVSDNGPCFTSLNLLGRMVLSKNWSAPTIKPQMARLKMQLKLLKVDWQGCQGENWKQSFHGSYSPTGQHPIPQLELHQQKCRWRGGYSQIWTGLGHPPLPLFSSAKIIRKYHHDRTAKMQMFHKGGFCLEL